MGEKGKLWDTRKFGGFKKKRFFQIDRPNKKAGSFFMGVTYFTMLNAYKINLTNA